MLNILLVEDDPHFLGAVTDVLTEQGWKVTGAPDGKKAREIINVSSPFDLIISDTQMPHLTGIELLQWVQSNKPTPFVLMTGFSLVMETKKAHDLGASDFLLKPFETHDLLDMVKRLCGHKLNHEKPEKKKSENEYCKVSLEEFVSAGNLNFDVHVKLGSRYVKIGRKGDPIPVDRIHTYKSKGLKHLYVLKDDFRTLVSFNLNLAKTVAQTDKIQMEKKANFMRYTGEVILERAFIAGVDDEAYNEARDFLTTSMNVLTDEPNSLNLLESLNSHSDHIYAHSLCVSIFSVLIAKQMGWTSTANLFKLSVAGIFHDIGKKELDRELLAKPRPLLTHTERKAIETHPLRGRDILLELKAIPSEAVAVAYEHHEDQIGTGFPRGISKHAIHPFAQIVRVANLFAEFALKSPTHSGMSPAQAIKHLEVHYRDSMAPEPFLALAKIFKVPVMPP